MAIEKPPINNGNILSREWVGWMTKLWTVVTTVNSSGTTAQRPTTSLFIGMAYFDTTLGKPIWLKSVGPVVWCDATGTAA